MVITDVRIDDHQKGIMERGVENSAAGRASPIEWEISNNSALVFQQFVLTKVRINDMSSPRTYSLLLQLCQYGT